MSWEQKIITLNAPSRGFHLITNDIYKKVPEISGYRIGLLHLFIQHTSASLSLNENCDPDVRSDMESAMNLIVPESWNKKVFKHTMEGDDDMPGHVKSSLIGASVSIPIGNGKLQLGTWQGIYLCEHRNTGGYSSGHDRKIVATLQGVLL